MRKAACYDRPSCIMHLNVYPVFAVTTLIVMITILQLQLNFLQL